MRQVILWVGLVSWCVFVGRAQALEPPFELSEWATAYLTESHAIDAETPLLAAGQPGLDAVMAFAKAQKLIDDTLVRQKIDRLAGQRDAWASGLFWHRDLDAALAEAEASGRPILSLRLLGRLDNDLSCANSRFFRTALYANQAIADYLRDHYVLHWESVRPVPVMTIEFGDGRTLRRTITGNSFHYVLDPRGRMVDVLPGLYNPVVFQELLQRAESFAQGSGGIDSDADFRRLLTEFHTEASQQLSLTESMLLAAATPALPDSAVWVEEPANAFAADRLTIGKSVVEVAPLAAFQGIAVRDLPDDDATWDTLAAAYRDSSALDETSRALFFEKEGRAAQANEITVAKRRMEDPAIAALRRFEDSLARDTAMNEHRLHRQFHIYVTQGGETDDLEALTRYIYAELFLAPINDPWYGLNPPDAYSALDGRGEWVEVDR
ncbi:hypothetical protein [Algisphaera agarilytica]|uniref:Uncharacterized protein n=1 Tax=Algisphaera agarilytica TaxID=1385975 RepID=A0A7X0LKK6_9BACT|nr:hypothetical protein [Algisphaera agarilytica]MBB6429944.1 hypothetical protein [Algisphaera agarilytica]